MKQKKDNKMVHVRIDRNTVVIVPKEKATPDYAEKFRKACERSQRMARSLM